MSVIVQCIHVKSRLQMHTLNQYWNDNDASSDTKSGTNVRGNHIATGHLVSFADLVTELMMKSTIPTLIVRGQISILEQ